MTRSRRRRKRKGRDPKVYAERFIVGREMARKERRDEKVGREKGLTVSLSVLSIRSVTGYPSVPRHLFSIELNPFLLIFTSAIGPRYFPILGKNREETRDLLAPRSGRSNWSLETCCDRVYSLHHPREFNVASIFCNVDSRILKPSNVC